MIIEVLTSSGAVKFSIGIYSIVQILPQSGGRSTRFKFGSGNNANIDINLAYSTVMDELRKWLNPSIGARSELGRGPNYVQDKMITLQETS